MGKLSFRGNLLPFLGSYITFTIWWKFRHIFLSILAMTIQTFSIKLEGTQTGLTYHLNFLPIRQHWHPSQLRIIFKTCRTFTCCYKILAQKYCFENIIFFSSALQNVGYTTYRTHDATVLWPYLVYQHFHHTNWTFLKPYFIIPSRANS